MTSLRPVPATRPRAVLYLRQSVHRDDSISIELQESAGRDYCARMGYDVVRIEADEGISGRKWDNRPAVIRVLDMIEASDADIIVLWKWSRLSRSRRDWALASDRVDVAGGRIESATEPIDTGTASGRFARGVMTEYAAFQSEQIGEQWEEVRQRRLRLGLPVSGRLPWGWGWVKPGIEPDPGKAPVVVEMYRRYLAGDGSAKIARWLNAQAIPAPNGGPWSRVRPFTVLDSPIHAGLIPYRGANYPGAHEGIIDSVTWAEYLSRRDDRTKPMTRATPGKYLLSGMIRCACGKRMQGKGSITDGKWYSGYICTSAAVGHGRNYVASTRINPVVRAWLAAWADAVDDAVDLAPRVEGRASLERMQAEWNAQQRRLDKLTELLISDVVPLPSYTAARAEVEARQADLQSSMDAIRIQLGRSQDVSTEVVRDMIAHFEVWTGQERHELLREVLEEALVTPGDSVIFTSRWGEVSSVMTL